MQLAKADTNTTKGWLFGRWNSNLGISIGFANAGVDEPHLHERTREIYLIARGTAKVRVETQTVLLRENDVIVIEPGEAHTFLSSSPDYFHFVLHIPSLKDEEAATDKLLVPRSRLGLA